MCFSNDILQWKFFLERFGLFLTQKVDFYSSDRKTYKLFNVLVVGFGPKGRPGRMRDSVR